MSARSRDVRATVSGWGRLLCGAAVLVFLLAPAKGGGAAQGDGSGAVPLAPTVARPGQLDPSFGGGGTVVTDFPSQDPPTLRLDTEATAVLVQPDGKIVATGFGSGKRPLARYNPDGSLDGGFGSGGILTSEMYGGPAYGTNGALLLQPDGRLVTVGTLFVDSGGVQGSHFGLTRFNPDGTLDAGFGQNGFVTTVIDARGDAAQAAVLQPDGKIVAAGGALGGLALARYLLDGSLDQGFGAGGIVTTNAAGTATALFLLPDGRLVAAATTTDGRFALVRFNPDGTVDTGFGTLGIVATDLQGERLDVALQPDGRFLTVGFTQRKTADFLLLRFNSDGSADRSFGNRGQVATDFGGGDDFANALLLQADGRIVVAGSSFRAARPDLGFALARYTPDGRLDQGFGKKGKTVTSFSFVPCNEVVCISAFANALALQPDGRLVAAGGFVYSAEVGQRRGFALARYL